MCDGDDAVSGLVAAGLGASAIFVSRVRVSHETGTSLGGITRVENRAACMEAESGVGFKPHPRAPKAAVVMTRTSG
jgi:hypothetical protein